MLYFSPKLAKACDSEASQIVAVIHLSLFQFYWIKSWLLHLTQQYWIIYITLCTDMIFLFLTTLQILVTVTAQVQVKQICFHSWCGWVNNSFVTLETKFFKNHLSLYILVKHLVLQSLCLWSTNISFRRIYRLLID